MDIPASAQICVSRLENLRAEVPNFRNFKAIFQDQ